MDLKTIRYEVDAGVGGAAAIEVGRRLQALSSRTQVIVVTHLAQVAAFADGVIVGSAFLRRILQAADHEQARAGVRELAAELAQGVRR